MSVISGRERERGRERKNCIKQTKRTVDNITVCREGGVGSTLWRENPGGPLPRWGCVSEELAAAAHHATPIHCPCTWPASPLTPGLGHRLMRVSSDDLLSSPFSSSQPLVSGCCLPRGTSLGLGPACECERWLVRRGDDIDTVRRLHASPASWSRFGPAVSRHIWEWGFKSIWGSPKFSSKVVVWEYWLWLYPPPLPTHYLCNYETLKSMTPLPIWWRWSVTVTLGNLQFTSAPTTGIWVLASTSLKTARG